MDVLEPKLPEDIYKTSDALSSSRGGRGGAAVVESARANLASSFVNAFVNAGMCGDKLMLGSEAGSSWVSRNKVESKSDCEWVLSILSIDTRRSSLTPTPNRTRTPNPHP